MATPLADVIENLQTRGGTDSNRPLNFADQSSIRFFIAANGNGGQFAILIFDVESLALLALGASFIGGIGEAHPAAGNILGGYGCGKGEQKGEP